MDRTMLSSPDRHPFLPGRSARGGLTLFEVLVAMAVVTIGLLGVLSLFAVAYRSVAEVNKADRVRACSEWATQQVYLYNMLDASSWRTITGGSFVITPGSAPFLIDPPFVARNGYSVTTAPAPSQSPATAIDRRSVVMPGGLAFSMTWAAASRVFVAEEDLTFVKPDDQGLRLRAEFLDSSLDITDDVSQAIRPSADQEYSWFLMVRPLPAPEGRVVVCYRRDFNPFSEKAVPIAAPATPVFPGGAGEIELATGDFDIPEDSWLLVGGRWTPPILPPNTPQFTFQWYRVVAAIRPDLSTNNRWALSLEGDAWNNNYLATHVILMPSVQSVSNALTP